MATTQTAPHDSALAHAARHSASSTGQIESDSSRPRRTRPDRPPTDDEILGLVAPSAAAHEPEDLTGPPQSQQSRDDNESSVKGLEPENLRAAFDANPELRQAWHDARDYRESFATPQEARDATALLADLDHMDALFFSRRPEDHAELARAVASLDPEAFASLVSAMSAHAASGDHSASHSDPIVIPRPSEAALTEERTLREQNRQQVPRSARNHSEIAGSEGQLGPAQVEFFHSANAAAVKNVLDAIEARVERLLPEGVSKSARDRVVGEIYRELDGTLRSNRQLAQQMRNAFRSGSLDANHQRALVSLITSRARQALPGVAKRVLNEWTSTIVAANQDRRARQRAAESRVDIAGSGRAGNDGIRPLTPRDIDYARLSDSDILNL